MVYEEIFIYFCIKSQKPDRKPTDLLLGRANSSTTVLQTFAPFFLSTWKWRIPRQFLTHNVFLWFRLACLYLWTHKNIEYQRPSLAWRWLNVNLSWSKKEKKRPLNNLLCCYIHSWIDRTLILGMKYANMERNIRSLWWRWKDREHYTTLEKIVCICVGRPKSNF